MHWVACAPADLAWAGLSGDFAVYHRPSGKTHFVNEPTALLLSGFLDSPRSTPEIAQALAAAQSQPVDARYEADVATLLWRLADLGLVDPVRK